ncbi:conserved hypothetical protein [Paraburkholderia sacchari]|uniref:hypothetical protein n=1 Tax=Paraburkholderia sacchari TaxID=159450 RepID=UPI0039A68321
MTDTFDPIESHQRTTAVLIGRVRAALSGDAQRWLQGIEARGGTVSVRSWLSGEISVEVTLEGAPIMVFWLMTRNGVGVLLDPPAAALERLCP